MTWTHPTIGILATALLIMTGASALAAPTLSDGTFSGDDENSDTFTFEISDERPEAAASVEAVSDDGDATAGPHSVYSFPVVSTDPVTGEQCTAQRYAIAATPEQAGAASADARARADAYFATVGGDPPPPCSTVTIDDGEVARRAAEQVIGELTPAQPSVQPNNSAITGIRSHLTTGVDSERTTTFTVTLFGRDWDVTIDITGTHTIDWGDGTVDTGVVGDGGPWHDGEAAPGDIVHHYLHAGDYPLVVTTDWIVTATLPVTGATAIQNLTTTSIPVTIDVDEVRSARDR